MAKRVLLDCDGVLVDHITGFVKWCNIVYDGTYDASSVTSWGMAECLGITKEQEDAFYTESNCESLEAYPGAQEFLRTLQSRHIVRACTASSNSGWTAGRSAWLEQFGIPVREQIILGSDEKQWHKADFLVDDKIANCIGFAKNWGRNKALLFDRLWNNAPSAEEHADVIKYGVRRVFNYQQVLAAIG